MSLVITALPVNYTKRPTHAASVYPHFEHTTGNGTHAIDRRCPR